MNVKPIAWIDAAEEKLLRGGSLADYTVSGEMHQGEVPLYGRAEIDAAIAAERERVKPALLAAKEVIDGVPIWHNAGRAAFLVNKALDA